MWPSTISTVMNYCRWCRYKEQMLTCRDSTLLPLRCHLMKRFRSELPELAIARIFVNSGNLRVATVRDGRCERAVKFKIDRPC